MTETEATYGDDPAAGERIAVWLAHQRTRNEGQGVWLNFQESGALLAYVADLERGNGEPQARCGTPSDAAALRWFDQHARRLEEHIARLKPRLAEALGDLGMERADSERLRAQVERQARAIREALELIGASLHLGSLTSLTGIVITGDEWYEGRYVSRADGLLRWGLDPDGQGAVGPEGEANG